MAKEKRKLSKKEEKRPQEGEAPKKGADKAGVDAAEAAEKQKKVKDVLDAIDDVLEEDAEEFVKSYVQRGGQ